MINTTKPNTGLLILLNMK